MKKLRLTLNIGIVLTCILGFVFPYPHPYFWWQKIPVFDALFGFCGGVLIIFLAKWLGHRWLTKSGDYYD